MVAALAGSAHATPSDRIRPLDPLARHLLDVGSQRLADLRQAARGRGAVRSVRLHRRKVRPDRAAERPAAVLGRARGTSLLRVRIDTGTTCRGLQLSRQYELAAIIGHELQHALEVADELDGGQRGERSKRSTTPSASSCARTPSIPARLSTCRPAGAEGASRRPPRSVKAKRPLTQFRVAAHPSDPVTRVFDGTPGRRLAQPPRVGPATPRASTHSAGPSRCREHLCPSALDRLRWPR
jgi:hypothetical protein